MEKIEEDRGKNKLIQGIREDAIKEADKILSDARAYVKERLAAAEAKASQIMDEAQKKGDEQAALVKRNMEAAIAVEKRRIELRVREDIISRAIDEVKKALYAMIGGPGYRDVLIGWITEAAIGLNTSSARVNTSSREKETLDEKLLRDAEAEIKKITGRNVALSMSKEEPALAQGVVLVAEDGKTAFNNQVPTRLLRYGPEIRRKIHEAFSGEV
ncbi:MAG: hypothetical protein JW881_02580 [Spirochaetales bacterium]|nr:hypothetical protein [Spirochaetales bacterium]